MLPRRQAGLLLGHGPWRAVYGGHIQAVYGSLAQLSVDYVHPPPPSFGSRCTGSTRFSNLTPPPPLSPAYAHRWRALLLGALVAQKEGERVLWLHRGMVISARC
jgi:hypothetical protein